MFDERMIILLDERKRQAILLLAENSKNKRDIAEIVGCGRTTLYLWLKDPEFVAELHSTAQRIQLFGENTIKMNLEKYIMEIDELSQHAESEKVRLEANQYLVDRVLGKTTAKLSLEQPERETKPITTEDIERELEEFDKALAEENRPATVKPSLETTEALTDADIERELFEIEACEVEEKQPDK